MAQTTRGYSNRLFKDDLLREMAGDHAQMSTTEIVKHLEERQAEARLSLKERQRKQKEREKRAKRRERAAYYLLPPRAIKGVKEVAAAEGVTDSQIAAFFILRGLEAYRRGEFDLDTIKVPSRSPRYDWKLVLEPSEDENLD
ncbi:MAG: hypothetical protein Kow0047_01380 [Anaerolineae bacterium]